MKYFIGILLGLCLAIIVFGFGGLWLGLSELRHDVQDLKISQQLDSSAFYWPPEASKECAAEKYREWALKRKSDSDDINNNDEDKDSTFDIDNPNDVLATMVTFARMDFEKASKNDAKVVLTFRIMLYSCGIEWLPASSYRAS